MSYSKYLKINDSFQYSVNLQFDLNSMEKIQGYIPTADSCEVLNMYFDSINGNFSKSTTLIGPYGKGKSHLLLVLLTLTNDYEKEHLDIIETLINKIKNVNQELFDKVVAFRKSKKRFLPIVINSNYDDIKQAFLIALKDSLEANNISNITIDTSFEAAYNLISDWKITKDNEIIDKLDNCLKQYKSSISKLCRGLKSFSDSDYKLFKQVYREVMHGVEFNPLVNMDVVKCYSDLTHKIAEYGYTGIFIVFDEFSKFLDSLSGDNTSYSLKIIQDFAELASRTSKDEQVLFSCITHKTLDEYAKKLDSDKLNAFKTVEGRFKEIYFNRSIVQNFEIISQTIVKKSTFSKFITSFEKENKAFYSAIEEKFKFCDFKDCKSVLFEGCMPLNPITTYCLSTLSELVAQNERTLFTFLSDGDVNSLTFFINNGNEKDLFNLDKVYDYFRPSFRKSSLKRINDIWVKTEGILSRVDNENEQKVLKSLAVIQMIDDFNMLPANKETLRLSMKIEINDFDKLIERLVDNGILRVKKSDNMFDFCSSANKKIENEIENIKHAKFEDVSIRKSLGKLLYTSYIIPRKYNQLYKMTRFFKAEYLTEDELLNLNSFKLLKNESFADGWVINLIRTSKNAKRIAEKIAEINDPQILIRVSKEQLNEGILDSIRKCEAIDYIYNTNEDEEDYKNELLLLKEDEIEYISNYFQDMFENSIKMYYKDGAITNNNIVEICSDICEKIFNKSPIINCEMINKQNITSPIVKARGLVIDSVLANDKTIIKNDTSAESTIYKSIVEKQGNKDIKDLIEIINKFISNTEKNQKQNFETIVNKLRKAPYGVRNGVLPVLFAMAFASFSDDIILYYKNRELEINSTNLAKIIDEPENYYIIAEKGTKEKQDYLMKMAELFNSSYEIMNRNNAKELTTKMKSWTLGLPRVSRDVEVANSIINNSGYIKIKNQLLTDDLNNNEFIFKSLKDTLMVDTYKDCFKEVSVMKNQFDNYTNDLIENLTERFKEKLAHNTKKSLNGVLTEWYKKIDDKVKNAIVSYNLKELLEYVGKLETYDDKQIFEDVSQIVLGINVEDWQNGTSEEFFGKIDDLLKEVDSFASINRKNQEKITLSYGDSDITKFITMGNITPIGNTLRNNIEDSINEYAGSISESEKIMILLEIIKKYM